MATFAKISYPIHLTLPTAVTKFQGEPSPHIFCIFDLITLKVYQLYVALFRLPTTFEVDTTASYDTLLLKTCVTL